MWWLVPITRRPRTSPGEVADQAFQLARIVDQAPCARQQGGPGGGQRDPPTDAVEQAGVELVSSSATRLLTAGWVRIQRLGRLGETGGRRPRRRPAVRRFPLFQLRIHKMKT